MNLFLKEAKYGNQNEGCLLFFSISLVYFMFEKLIETVFITILNC